MNLDKNIKYIPLLVLSTWFLGNMGTHFLLPLLPTLSNDLGSSAKLTQYIIAFFLAGKALGMIFYGPLSEVYGRRKFMLIGLLLYIFSSLLCAVATDIKWLILFRFIQGLGVSATILMGRVIINDSYPNNKAANVFGYLFALAAVIIACLPTLGGIIAIFKTWQLAFISMLIYSCFIFVIMLKYLPETQADDSKKKLSLIAIFKDYTTIFKHPVFFGYLMCTGLMVAGESAFNTNSAFLMVKTYGISVKVYGAMMSSLLVAHLLGAVICGRYVVKKGISNLTGIGALILVFAGFFLLLTSLLGFDGPYITISAMFIYFLGTGFIMTTAAVGVVSPFPRMIGTAMACALSLEFLLSSLSSFITSHLSIDSLSPIAILITTLSLFSFAMWFFYIKKS
ncbi:major facilitator transporter [Candidatus Francisella endociliophora]|uniref:Bcr/CflA family efflux transporter n=1 Tax=Candidatus Francisella endociliophora TaxID=653937 RepID=A0A097EPM0_9GAMM|nr:rhizoferrin import MFS transporter FslD [Francisella sp. FSC1006]AIT09515.1 major facilitator transporter [Francisella sp. FSC1006]